MKTAQDLAKVELSDAAPLPHFAAAASHFEQVLAAIGENKWTRTARDNRSIEYFLTMEMANCLAASELEPGEKLHRALETYERLSRKDIYKKDVPVHFRWGCALTKVGRQRTNIQKAIRVLQKARELAQDSDSELLHEGSWIYGEILKQLGLCNYRLYEMPGATDKSKPRYLDEAIQLTREAALRTAPAHDPDDFFKFSIMKAAGNLVYLLSQRIRDGRSKEQDEGVIADMLTWLREPTVWRMAENQVHIIDSMAMAAATIGDWATALELAELNVTNITSLATGGLTRDDTAIDARSREIVFFAKRLVGA